MVTGVAALAAAGGITAGIAGAAKDGGKGRERGGPPPFGPGPGYGPPPGRPGPGFEHEALTGDAKTKAESAAKAAVPGGTVVRSEKGGPDGAAYHVGMTGADGKPVLVLLDSDFKVTGTLTGPPRGGRPGFGGPGGPHGAPEALTGDAKAKAEDAAKAAVPGGTVVRSQKGGPDGAAYHVHMTDADGKDVVVRLDADFTVLDTVTPPDGGRHGFGPPGGPPAALTGDTADKAKAAALAAVPGGTVRDAFAAPDGADAAYVVFVERSNGRPAIVLLDKDFAVVRTLTKPRQRGGHPRRSRTRA